MSFSVQLWIDNDCQCIVDLPAVPRVGDIVEPISNPKWHDNRYCDRDYRVESVRWLVGENTWSIAVLLVPVTL